MPIHLLLPLSVLALTSTLQTEIHVKAGDPAPEIDWSKAVHSPDSAQYHPSLAGRYTVLRFLPNITANPQAIKQWNDLIAKFADQPVQFVWIASEPWSDVQAFLRQHPVNGWLLIDEEKRAAREYGIEVGDTAIIDPTGKIVGFTTFVEPDKLSAVLDGKAVAIPRGTSEDQVAKLLADGKVPLQTEPFHFPPPDASSKPNIAPSYDVRISPSNAKGTEGSAGPDFWIQKGFDLKTIVSMVYEKDPSRVVLPKQLDNGDRFDFTVVLPNPEDQKTIRQLVQRAIEKHFKVWASLENKPTDVYVMTAIKGKTPPAISGAANMSGSFISSSSVEVVVDPKNPEAGIKDAMRESPGLSNISASNTSINNFRLQLEQGLGRPIIDETGLTATYDLAVRGDAKDTDEFIRMLRDQTGLALTPATRTIEILTLHPQN